MILPSEDANSQLQNVHFTPELVYNLVSTGSPADNSIESHFRRSYVRLSLPNGTTFIGVGSRNLKSGMYACWNPMLHSAHEHCNLSQGTSKRDKTELWHTRLAHINESDLPSLHRHVCSILPLTQTNIVCRACWLGKEHKLPSPGRFKRASAVGKIVHSDIMGPTVLSFPDALPYVATFLYDHSRYLKIGSITHRSILAIVFQKVCEIFLGIGRVKISKLHSEGGKEYVALQKSLGGADDINKSFSRLYTPELNGIAKWTNCTFVEASICFSPPS